MQYGSHDQAVETAADQLDQQKSLPGKRPLYQFFYNTDTQRDCSDHNEHTADIVEKPPWKQNVIGSTGILMIQQREEPSADFDTFLKERKPLRNHDSLPFSE